MILELDERFAQIDLETDAVARMGIETLCLSVARGEHFIFSSRSVITKFESDQNLSGIARGVFSDARLSYAFNATTLRQLQYRVYVIPGHGSPARRAPKQWEIPIAHIAARGLRPTVLLGENSNDGDLYCYAAQHYRIAAKLNDILLKIQPRNGNGAGVSAELERISNAAEEFCLCITDSDRLSPVSGHGDIAAATRKIADGSAWVINHDAPFSRELENALPANLVDEVMTSLGLDEEIKKAARCTGQDTMLFADLKGGTTKHWTLNGITDQNAKSYWATKAESALPEAEAKCEVAGCDKDSCKCFVFPRITKDLAKHVHLLLKGASAHETYRRAKSSFNFDDWLRLGRDVLEAGAAPRPMRL